MFCFGRVLGCIGLGGVVRFVLSAHGHGAEEAREQDRSVLEGLNGQGAPSMNGRGGGGTAVVEHNARAPCVVHSVCSSSFPETYVPVRVLAEKRVSTTWAVTRLQ